MKQTTMDLFVGFKSDVHEHVNKRYKEMDDGNVENAMGMASVDLIESRKFNEDFELRNHLQGKVGPLATTIQNESIAELRKEQQKKSYFTLSG